MTATSLQSPPETAPAVDRRRPHPGPISSLENELAPELLANPEDARVVVDCAGPNDASTIVTSRKLLARGFRDMRRSPVASTLEPPPASRFNLTGFSP